MHVSSGNYTNTRSVSVDLDLEAGSYNIRIKIEPTRNSRRTAESVIESEAPYRKQKLLQTGRNFDLAHAKGMLREKEVEVRKQKKAQAKQKTRDQQAKMRERRHEAKARDRKRKDRIMQEKKDRETSFLLRRAGYVAIAPPLPPDNLDPPIVIIPEPGKVIGCFDRFDNDPNAELDDDDFLWDSDMDGDVYSSSSEDEPDWYAEDPWNALLVLGLRVYSHASGVTIKIRDGDDTDDEKDTPSGSTANKDGVSGSKGGESEQKPEDVQGQVQPTDSKTATVEDIAKQLPTSSQTTPTHSEKDKSSSNTAEVTTSSPGSDSTTSDTNVTNTTTTEQKN